MNVLHVGDPGNLPLDPPFLFIGDELPDVKGKIFDYAKHSINPLKDMDEKRADQFLEVLEHARPGGENTLTTRYANDILFDALLQKRKLLSLLVDPPKSEKDIYQKDAYQKVKRLLQYPVLKDVLDRPTNFSFRSRHNGVMNGPTTVLMRLNRAELGDKVCFILGNIAIMLYPGTIVVPDYGFYALPSHIALLRQKRLVAGVRELREISLFPLSLFDEKFASHCTPEDAKILANYAGLVPDLTREDSEYNKYIRKAVKGADV